MVTFRRMIAIACAIVAALMVTAAPAAAQCFNIAASPFPLIRASLPAGAQARLTYLGHSSFLIETAKGATAVTDFYGLYGDRALPDIVTMNNAHSSHHTEFVDPGIATVLRGWDPSGGMAEHDITHLDLRVRNVPTNVRGTGGTRYNGNSIFVFEIEDLCIAHLGHLHHPLTPVHIAELGRIDVVLVPMDGSMTMRHEIAAEVIRQLGSPVVIPMHYFGGGLVDNVARLLGGDWRVVDAGSREILLPVKTDGERIILVPAGGSAGFGDFSD